jgi:hypothetical protein
VSLLVVIARNNNYPIDFEGRRSSVSTASRESFVLGISECLVVLGVSPKGIFFKTFLAFKKRGF